MQHQIFWPSAGNMTYSIDFIVDFWFMIKAFGSIFNQHYLWEFDFISICFVVFLQLQRELEIEIRNTYSYINVENYK